MTPLDPSRLAAIRAREQAATKGPWTNGVRGSGPSGDAHMCRVVARDQDQAGNNYVVGKTWDPAHIVSYVGLSRQQCVDNAEFIAHAREDIPYLLAELARLQAEHTELKTKFIREGTDEALSIGAATASTDEKGSER